MATSVDVADDSFVREAWIDASMLLWLCCLNNLIQEYTLEIIRK
jgi:hypothetical protein